MPAKNTIRDSRENTFYHVYNRGVEKRNIFLDDQDLNVFLKYIEEYLAPVDRISCEEILMSSKSNYFEKELARKKLSRKNYYGEIELHCFALLPNHFHLLIHQKTRLLNKFMNSLGTRYGMYFNSKYERKGVLWEDVYKAVPVISDPQLLNLSRYIHL
ncbi:transposase, partial [Candidatus Collierbacteria bacterium]|nr:transposase [Candidatus Collierbacteria bacterium]